MGGQGTRAPRGDGRRPRVGRPPGDSNLRPLGGPGHALERERPRGRGRFRRFVQTAWMIDTSSSVAAASVGAGGHAQVVELSAEPFEFLKGCVECAGDPVVGDGHEVRLAAGELFLQIGQVLVARFLVESDGVGSPALLPRVRMGIVDFTIEGVELLVELLQPGEVALGLFAFSAAGRCARRRVRRPSR